MGKWKNVNKVSTTYANYCRIWIGSVANDSIQQDNAAIAMLVADSVLKLATGGIFALGHSRVPGFAVELDGYWATGLPSEGRIRVGDDEEE